MFSHEELKADLRYSPETGVFVRLPRPRDAFASGRQFATWNTRYSHQRAGGVYENGYRHIRGPDGRIYKAHRLAFLYMTGRWPEGEIDHINGDRDDNRWCNLRDVSREANTRNRKISASNSSGINGVYWRKDNRKWGAFINTAGGRKHLGFFDTKLDAAAERKSAERRHGYHQNHGRAA